VALDPIFGLFGLSHTQHHSEDLHDWHFDSKNSQRQSRVHCEFLKLRFFVRAMSESEEDQEKKAYLALCCLHDDLSAHLLPIYVVMD